MPPPGNGTYENRITRNGKTIRYLRISSGPQRDRYVHQLVAEAMLGRELRIDEEVDHKDDNTLNNDWRNLVVRTAAEHAIATRLRARERRQAGGRRDEAARGRDDLDGRRQETRRQGGSNGDQSV